MFLMLITSCPQETVIVTEEEEQQHKHEQKHGVLDEWPERWEAVIEDFCNTEVDTNA